MDGSSTTALLDHSATPLLDTDVEAPSIVVPDTVPVGLVAPPRQAADVTTPASDDQDGATPSLADVIARYGQYVALFVGAGLISGSVVHFPLAPMRYAVIGGVGAAIFAIASVIGERSSKDAAGLVRVAVTSLVLALGIGMISGSIQHFQDIPDRAATLIPLGLALSIAAFILRNGLRPENEDLAALALWSVTAIVALLIGLGALADRVGAAPGLLVPRGRRALKNVRDPIELWAVATERDAPGGALAIDPVCRMALDPRRAAARIDHEGALHHFCSNACAEAFERQPGRFRP
jgi:YHS domain-containing protein